MSRKFGVELEMTGITREQAATALAAYFVTDARYVGGAYDKWCVTDRDGKEWTVMSDSSIHGEQKIGSGIYYPKPLHHQPAYAAHHAGCIAGGPAPLPVSEALCDQVLSLPMHPYMTEADATRAAGVVLAATGAGGVDEVGS